MSQCKHCQRPIQFGDWPFCPHGPARSGGFASLNTPIQAGERVVVYEHPGTGEVRYPMRADRVGQTEQRYLETGYQRRTLDSIADLRAFERRRGVRHERSNWGEHGDESSPC
jgi:hypothetical protein